MKTVSVVFTSRESGQFSNTYEYLVADDVAVEVGDFAVAHNGTQYAIVRVTKVSMEISQNATKSLVVILNNQVYADYQKQNEAVNEQKRMFVRLQQLMDQEYEKNKYRVLAQSNAEAADLAKKLGLV
jgi:proline racemase